MKMKEFGPRGGGRQECAIIFQLFGRKLHENERIWTRGPPPRIPGTPLGSANAVGA